ncbi:hypothetical protein PV325_013953 [Microctonus aethiopoides]|nr:hypothetical protein PV325_013953 [Microctonus aethiopoides]KAK0091756.1 hypothetical protein PV326_002748 [Microctonus aethiopoides]
MDVNGSTGNISSVEGPSPFEDIPAILTAVVLALIILTTVIGNVLVIAAIYSEKNLQSVANYLIVSLAVADLMVACLVMPLGAFYEMAHSGEYLNHSIGMCNASADSTEGISNFYSIKSAYCIMSYGTMALV